jgi:hypothetical protein
LANLVNNQQRASVNPKQYSDMEHVTDTAVKFSVSAQTGFVESSSSNKYLEMPGFGSIWTAPPKSLPGPDNHPFFSTNWEALNLSETRQPFNDTEIPTTQKNCSTPGMPLDAFRFGPPPVFPYIPGPAIELLPTTPDDERVRIPEGNLPLVSPVVSTPGLTDSQTNIDELSPQSRPTNFDHGTNEPVLDQSDVKECPSELVHSSTVSASLKPGSPSPRDAKMNPTLSTQPVCHVTYLRAVPNEATTEPAVLLNGQLWRSSNQKRKGWRRNQWVVDVR